MALFELNALSCPLERGQIQALRAALAGLSPAQLAWVSGYLAGVAGLGERPAAEPAGKLTVLYGSQTGNARAIAEGVGEHARTRGIEVQVVSMGDYNPRQLAGERITLLVASTHGEGEPPESARALHAFLHAKRAPRLEHLRYAVLGLGDSSYEHFCRAAREFDARLAELGAERLLPGRYCDVDYHGDARAWAESVLEKAFESAVHGGADIVPLSGAVSVARHDKDNPYTATLIENRRITVPEAVADVRHLALAAAIS